MKTVRRARRGLSGAELSDRTQNIGGDIEAWNIETEPKLPLETRRRRSQSESRRSSQKPGR